MLIQRLDDIYLKFEVGRDVLLLLSLQMKYIEIYSIAKYTCKLTDILDY